MALAVRDDVVCNWPMGGKVVRKILSPEFQRIFKYYRSTLEEKVARTSSLGIREPSERDDGLVDSPLNANRRML